MLHATMNKILPNTFLLFLAHFTSQFLEKMQLDYNIAAHENNCYVVGSCGFDSIPADLGTVFLEDKHGGLVNSVESYIEVKAERV